MAIKFSRIDDRLIHGQVITTWVNVFNIEQIIIVNDAVAKDEVQQSVLKMSAPQGITMRVFPVEKFGEVAKNNPITRSTMLLFTTSTDVLRAMNAGLNIVELNVGGMRYQDGRTKYTRAVSLTPEEKEAFEEIMAKGVDVEIQMVPKDEEENMKEVLTK